ncbi:hypothetical protein L1047_03205 [Synechococcus sp. Nb3U1]|uniref:hypothetical protein n=1 Tax=Synechococcus sp. Nb3U1 TaxID=1914529 RepID=UPI001F3F6C78|nr:hypothetical protein [Synechococcus sp. Nb3U1]MCF2970202.1 hypothetical protein [Synechococcus sp. Nb3U1]
MTSLQSSTSFVLQKPAWLPAHVWIQTCQQMAQGYFWASLLTTIGCLGNITYTCTLPFVTIGILTGTTLTRSKAIVSTLMIWFSNQIFGYLLHNYPRTPDSFAWGIVLGISTLSVTLMASYRPLFKPDQLRMNYIWIPLMLLLGFLGFQTMIFLAGLFLGGTHGLTLPVLGKIWLDNWIWTGLWIGIHSLWVWLKIRSI